MRNGYVVLGDFVTARDDDDVTAEMVVLWVGKRLKTAKMIAAAVAADAKQQLSTRLQAVMCCFYPAVAFAPDEYMADEAAKTAEQLVQTTVVRIRNHLPQAAIASYEVKARKYLQAMPRQYAKPVPRCSVDTTASMPYVWVSPELCCFVLTASDGKKS